MSSPSRNNSLGNQHPNESNPIPPRRELTDCQKGDLARLWARHSSETAGDDDSSPFGTTSDGGASLDDHTYSFLARLHSFLVTTLSPPSPSQRDVKVMDSSPTRRTEHRSTLNALKGLLLCHPSRRKSNAADTTTIPHRVKLLEGGGRHVIVFDHASFNNELDEYELRGMPISSSSEFRQTLSFGAFLHHRPSLALAALGCAIGLTMATVWRRQQHDEVGAASQQLGRALDGCYFVVRFTNVNPTLRMVDVKTKMSNKFVAIKGHVIKAKPKRLRVCKADFQCSKCGEQFAFKFHDGRYNIPDKCLGIKCRSKVFSLIRSTAQYIDFQELKLQETQDETTDDAGRTPRQLEVELTDDLVDVCNAGDIVKIAGIIKPISTAIAAGKTGRRALETSTYKLYMKANSIANTTSEMNNSNNDQHANKKQKSSNSKGGMQSLCFTQDQINKITKVAHADHRMGSMRMRQAFPFDLLVHSLCPSIIGHHLVKAGLLLGILGGTPPLASGLEARSSNSIRSNSHILIVGDPGMGKSQMLLAVNQIASRSIYVGGNTASTTGLTVSLTKESGGEVGIEAGALVLADQGVCCIDEFDKMAKTNQDGLLEAMEQQQISIAKAGVVASLPARCSVIAAANPKHGNYNMGKTVAENLNMATPLLSRFDLVFILRDRSDLDQDRLVSSNIMNLYRQRDTNGEASRVATTGVDQCNETGYSNDRSSANNPEYLPEQIQQRLAWVASFQKECLPADVLRDYIAYAREYCRPKLSRAAANVLKEYFMDLRYPTNGENRNDSVPITTRQLEALIRLSQARAKACLRDFVLVEDAKDVVELMRQSVNQVHMDERGNIDKTRGGAGGKSKRKAKRIFLQSLQNQQDRLGVTEFSMDDLRRVADGINSELSGFQSMVEELRQNGEIIKTSQGKYKLT